MKIMQDAIAAALVAGAVVSAPASAGTIIGATSAVVAGGNTFAGTSINNTFNQNGLLTNYTSGVTDFDAYLASNPKHNLAFANNEWFSSTGPAQVTYNFGAIVSIQSFALWNEDSRGAGPILLSSSIDGVTFTSLGLFTPIASAANQNYGAQRYDFAAASAQYVRLDMTRSSGVAIGEVAFNTAAAVPEPATWGMMILGFGMIGAASRRRSVKTNVKFA